MIASISLDDSVNHSSSLAFENGTESQPLTQRKENAEAQFIEPKYTY
jgi:hypothetical protein